MNIKKSLLIYKKNSTIQLSMKHMVIFRRWYFFDGLLYFLYNANLVF